MPADTPTTCLHYSKSSSDDTPTELTARFHADFHKGSAEDFLSGLSHVDDVQREMPDWMTIAREAKFLVVTVEFPPDPSQGEQHCVTLAKNLRGHQIKAAAITRKTVDPATGGEGIFVLASDATGNQEAWYGPIMRCEQGSPMIAEWEPIEAGGLLMFTLHAGVGNHAGVRKIIARDGVPPAFA